MTGTPRIAALIVAAGKGLRAGGGTPKQYRMLAGRSVLARATGCLLALPEVALVQVVIAPGDEDACALAMARTPDPRLLPPVPGGPSRQSSVRAGLAALAAHAPDVVMIHDGARPFLAPATARAALAALHGHDGAVPALHVVDALWHRDTGPHPRDGLYRVQTPQVFRFDAILAAHQGSGESAADDATVARAAGLRIALAPGDEGNYKLTTQADFARAERDLGAQMDMRCGTGFDVHAFGPGDHVMLCGVPVPHDRGLSGHSDADVAMHAITDALFGALAEGDIGQWFPPSDPQWRGADSSVFLRKAAERVAARGLRIGNLDCTIICETPKIGPHAAAMRARLAEILALEVDRISVKATTTERLGFAGRGEGIAAQAVALLVPA